MARACKLATGEKGKRFGNPNTSIFWIKYFLVIEKNPGFEKVTVRSYNPDHTYLRSETFGSKLSIIGRINGISDQVMSPFTFSQIVEM